MNDITKTAREDTNPMNADKKTTTSMKMVMPLENCDQVKQFGTHTPSSSKKWSLHSNGTSGGSLDTSGSVSTENQHVLESQNAKQDYVYT